MGRLTIGSCDFSTCSYDYAHSLDCHDFNIDYEKENIDILLQRALDIKEMTLFAAPWSPPVQFKTTDDKNHGGKLDKTYYRNYAKYLCKYVEAQQTRGIPLKYITIQNEPETTQTWESCIYNEEEELNLVKTFHDESKNYNFNVDILLWDHNRDVLPRRAENYKAADSEFMKYTKGFAYHWYDGDKWDNLSKIHELYPDCLLVFTEGCIELLSLNADDPSSAIGTMNNAFRYARNYICDSLNYSNGFIDWNLLLDEKGGPNHVGNFCEALIQFDTNKKELIINPSFHVVKHFAHFIKPNAYRIDIQNKTDMLITSYLNPDKEIVVVFLNEGEEKQEVIEVRGKKYCMKLPSLSISTCVFK
ncbi:MAG: glycoside hydrolase family 30 protein [Erysipelotrichales bacterium]|nr:glycoside hydrolase family 30 protein [Erysipelotrichales bacterium]